MNSEVFKQRFLPFHPKLYRIAYALVENRDDAEDLMQETYCRLWDKRDTLDEIVNPEAYALTILKHLCLDFLRSPKSNRGENLEKAAPLSVTTPQQALEGKELLKQIREIIRRLPENQRQVVRLHSIEDCSYKEIEQLTGLSNNNIRTLLSRARQQIKEQLKKITDL